MFAREVAVCLRLPGYNPKDALIREGGGFRPMKQRCQRNWVAALAAVAILAAVGGMATGCALPPLEGRSVSSALDMNAARSTRLGEAIALLTEARPRGSGARLIADPEEAFATWVQLTRAAERTLDLQYYIWYGDTAGTLMLGELQKAAAQGVRVRLLLDDQGTSGLDTTLATLDAHPNIEVRLFNPFVLREFKWLGFLTDFSRANRRMHDKALIADNQVALIGGRNIGDRYFSSTDGFLFFDLDVLAVGAVVRETSARFDAFWTSRSSYPADRILPDVMQDEGQQAQRRVGEPTNTAKAAEYAEVIRDAGLVPQLLAGEAELAWAPIWLVGDSPAKGLGRHERNAEGLLTYQLREIFGTPTTSLDIISSFFVPPSAVTESLIELSRRGVRIRVLTNSLDATDMPPAHAGYARYRKPLLKAGVELYEMRRLSLDDEPQIEIGPFGKSATSLHAKAIVVDGMRLFVGSYNVDPRSVNLNTELGLVIDSRKLAAQVSSNFHQHVPQSAYRLGLDDGKVFWIEQTPAGQVRHDREPKAGWIKRGAVWLFSLLPFEWML